MKKIILLLNKILIFKILIKIDFNLNYFKNYIVI